MARQYEIDRLSCIFKNLLIVHDKFKSMNRRQVKIGRRFQNF